MHNLPKIDNKFRKGSAKLNMRTIFVEGHLDKKIYTCFTFISDLNNINFEVLNGGCGNIKSTLEESTNYYAIIDNDYREISPHPRAARINYYSIENILLKHHDKFAELKKIIKKHIEENGIGNIRLNKIKLTANKNLVSYTRINKEFHQYLKRQIKTFEQFINYSNLKEIVNSFDKNECNYKTINISYIKELKELCKNSIKPIISTKDYPNISHVFS